jgi:hypothetical protein
MGPDTASRFRAVLELVGAATLVAALGGALMVQLDVWRAVRSDGDEDEDDDFKVRTEERQLKELKQAVEEKTIAIAKLKQARAVVDKEKADVKAMRIHREKEMVTENPLQDQAPGEVDDGVEDGAQL